MGIGIITIPRVVKGIMVTFLCIIMMRFAYPVVDIIIRLFPPDSMMRVSAILGYYLIVVFVFGFGIWTIVLTPEEREGLKESIPIGRGDIIK